MPSFIVATHCHFMQKLTYIALLESKILTVNPAWNLEGSFYLKVYMQLCHLNDMKGANIIFVCKFSIFIHKYVYTIYRTRVLIHYIVMITENIKDRNEIYNQY